MLFSREDVATLINYNFEASWETVRPVPIVRIDFGNGRAITRTLHGNIASYVCAADGTVTDILPGMYTPAVYRAALFELRSGGSLPRTEGQRQDQLREYHLDRARRLRAQPTQIVYEQPVVSPRDVGKGRIEFRTEQIFVRAPAPRRGGPAGLAGLGPRPPRGADLAEWELLATDTWRNETERRLLIHDRLAQAALQRPEQLTRWLYRDVLHADLDDPYLGLGDALIGDDVFREVET